jgi:hypothetical protein
MPRVGFETSIPVYKRAKSFRALHRAATVSDMLATFCFEFFRLHGEVKKKMKQEPCNSAFHCCIIIIIIIIIII